MSERQYLVSQPYPMIKGYKAVFGPPPVTFPDEPNEPMEYEIELQLPVINPAVIQSFEGEKVVSLPTLYPKRMQLSYTLRHYGRRIYVAQKS